MAIRHDKACCYIHLNDEIMWFHTYPVKIALFFSIDRWYMFPYVSIMFPYVSICFPITMSYVISWFHDSPWFSHSTTAISLHHFTRHGPEMRCGEFLPTESRLITRALAFFPWGKPRESLENQPFNGDIILHRVYNGNMMYNPYILYPPGFSGNMMYKWWVFICFPMFFRSWI